VEVQLKSTASYKQGNKALLYYPFLSLQPVKVDSMGLRRAKSQITNPSCGLERGQKNLFRMKENRFEVSDASPLLRP
jgi:hypothetical protein